MAIGPVKKNPASRIGSTKINKKKGLTFKSWQALVAVLFVAVVGYTVVQLSHAGTRTTFAHYSKKINGGSSKKVGRTTYKVVTKNGSATLSTLISASELRGAQRLCFHYKSFSRSSSGTMSVVSTVSYGDGTTYTDGSSLSSYFPGSSGRGICAPVDPNHAKTGAQYIIAINNNTRNIVGVDVMYGQ